MSSDLSLRLREDYLSGEGIFGQFIYPYSEELKKSKFFLETMEDFVASSEQSEVTTLEKGLEGLNSEQKDEFWQWHYPIHWQEIFSNRIRAAFIMQMCSFVEGELNEICDRVRVISRAPIKVSDLQGSTLSKAKKFLAAFAKLDLPSKTSWDEIQRVFDVRNVMVHEGGFAGSSKNRNKVTEFATIAPGLALDNNHLEVKREFCEYCLASVSRFCDELYGAYHSFRETAFTLSKLEVR
jgi:hypothetical protein